MNLDSIIKRANRLVSNAINKIHSARVHIVQDDADISELSGLVIILNRTTSKTAQTSTESTQEAGSSDIS